MAVLSQLEQSPGDQTYYPPMGWTVHQCLAGKEALSPHQGLLLAVTSFFRSLKESQLCPLRSSSWCWDEAVPRPFVPICKDTSSSSPAKDLMIVLHSLFSCNVLQLLNPFLRLLFLL